MELIIPASVRAEHEALYRELAAATKEAGRIGDAARAVAELLQPHFITEEALALPPLALLAPLVRGERISGSSAVTAMTDKLKAELPRMLAEHRAIVAAAQKLAAAARTWGDGARLALAEKIAAHAEVEEEVFYPAAILVGEYLKLAR
jgi:Hemerythrin HHE cation binding domain